MMTISAHGNLQSVKRQINACDNLQSIKRRIDTCESDGEGHQQCCEGQRAKTIDLL
jgi:hypothetical protein